MPTAAPQMLAHLPLPRRDLATGLVSRFSGGFFPTAQAEVFRLLHAQDLPDLCGKHLSDVMPHVGWGYVALPVAAEAIDRRGECVAMAWAGLVRRDDGNLGLNLSYGVAPQWRGKGLATWLAAQATEAWSTLPFDRSHRAGVQTRDSNHAAIATALALGLARQPRLDFKCQTGPERNELRFQGLDCDARQFILNCASVLSARPSERVAEEESSDEDDRQRSRFARRSTA